MGPPSAAKGLAPQVPSSTAPVQREETSIRLPPGGQGCTPTGFGEEVTRVSGKVTVRKP